MSIIRWWRKRRAERLTAQMRAIVLPATERAFVERIAPRLAHYNAAELEDLRTRMVHHATEAVDAFVAKHPSGTPAQFVRRLREVEPFITEQVIQSVLARIEGRTPPDLWTPPPGSPMH